MRRTSSPRPTSDAQHAVVVVTQRERARADVSPRASGRFLDNAQFADLLRGAGLRLCRVVPTHTQLSVIEARPETD